MKPLDIVRIKGLESVHIITASEIREADEQDDEKHTTWDTYHEIAYLEDFEKFGNAASTRTFNESFLELAQ